jgi:hypothetical protein
MPDRPDARDLLGIARELLLRKLLPALPEQLHYDARMVANAIAIATREIELAANTGRAEWEQTMDILNQPVLPMAPQPALAEEVNRVRRKLTNAIRDGLFDAPGERQQVLLETLTQIVRGKLAISNPKALLRRSTDRQGCASRL